MFDTPIGTLGKSLIVLQPAKALILLPTLRQARPHPCNSRYLQNKKSQSQFCRTPDDKASRPAISRQTHHYPRCWTREVIKVAMECRLGKERDGRFERGFEEGG